ncbi:MAG: DNA polymerase IV [Thermoproteota archaeon]|nr:DNA polymerase IV [Thermoproteota archaeon]
MFKIPVDDKAVSRLIFHIDLDYFYAQCEEIRNPEFRNQPVVVCVYSGRNPDSGVVSTSNYKARELGVKSGMPIKIAKSRLENRSAMFLPVDMIYYNHLSKQAIGSVRKMADTYEYVGIDECYADFSRSSGCDFTKARKIANLIQGQIRVATDLTCSIGVGPNKIIAKIASNFQKPSAITIINPRDVKTFIESLHIEDIPGIGPKNRQKLESLGIRSVGHLARFDLFRLKELFGYKIASYLQNAAHGIDDTPLRPHERSKQIGKIVTLKNDVTAIKDILPILTSLSSSVHDILVKRQLSFKTTVVILVLHNLRQVTSSRSLKLSSTSLAELQYIARSLLLEAINVHSLSFLDVRRVGITLSDLTSYSGQNSILQYFTEEVRNSDEVK